MSNVRRLMVFLAITRHGYESYQALGGVSTEALWVAAGVLTSDELATLRLAGGDVTDFNYTIELQDSQAISGAVETIKEHHPGEPVWVEA
jgi:hypothetical protein